MENGWYLMQTIRFYVDDSGNLSSNEPSKHFVYGGYVFTNRNFRERKQREYKALAKSICASLGIDEAKAFHIKRHHKRALMNVMKDVDSFSSVSNVNRVYDDILGNKRSRCRFKDFVLKMAIKQKLIIMVNEGKIDPNVPTHLIISIDEQPTATNGFYALRESIHEEFTSGFHSFDYGRRHPNIFNSTLQVEVHYRSSHSDYLVQAADILANRVWAGTINNNEGLLNVPLHSRLIYP